MKGYHQMTEEERYQLEALLNARIPKAQIARQLGFSRKTIYNEIRRGEYEYEHNGFIKLKYSADKGQQIHDLNATAKGAPIKLGKEREYAAYLEKKILKDRYSPAAALAAAKKDGFEFSICRVTLYSYISKGIFLHLTNKDLWIKGKKKKRRYKKVQRIAHPLLPSISNRPQKINDRTEYGHWEMDLIIGKRSNDAALLTLTERQTRQELIFKIPDKKANTIRNVFDQLEAGIPQFKEIFKSITTDNGPEFLKYEELRSSIHGGYRFDLYYCHSFASWEKGTVENHNRMIRRFFPKKTRFKDISEQEIADVQNWMNNYPRRILGWKTPNEAAA